MNTLRIVIHAWLFLVMVGCAALNPYHENFSCPKTSKGKCVDVSTAYTESVQGVSSNDAGKSPDIITKLENEERLKMNFDKAQGDYQGEVYRKLSGLLLEPETPMMTPPLVVRILMLPYKGEGSSLYMHRYVYIMVDEAQWVLEKAFSDEAKDRGLDILNEKSSSEDGK